MISSWRSSRFVMWVPPNHLLNPIRLLFILLWGAVSISLLKEKEAKFTFIRLPFVRHLNFWTTLNVTNWVGKAGWWSPSLSPSCLSASSLGGRPSPSRCRGTSPCGGCWERLSSWSTPSSSSTFSNPTMCHSQKRSTSGWGLRLEAPQVRNASSHTWYNALWPCQLTYFLLTGTPVRHRDPPGVERGGGGEGDHLEVDESREHEGREEKKDKWNWSVLHMSQKCKVCSLTQVMNWTLLSLYSLRLSGTASASYRFMGHKHRSEGKLQ